MTVKSYLSTLLSLTMALTSSASFAASSSDGTYFFRYNTNLVHATPVDPGDNESESKDVSVFYVAGIGFEFEEVLPLKPEWQNDDWRIVKGTLPDGITFDPATRTFSGIPTTEKTNDVVELAGYDSTGNAVAKATASFDVVALQGVPVATTLYAHTNHYKVDELPVPAQLPANTAIESWAQLYALPDGMGLASRYVQGTPKAPGTYKLLITGKDYKGNVVVTYFGKYLVDDGPSFPKIADQVFKLPQLEHGYGLHLNFGAPNPFGVIQSVDPNKGVRYFVERKDPVKPFPGDTASNDQPLNLAINGWVYQPYQTADIRFKAVDVDGTVGYSNWFAFGSADPQPGCNPYSYGTIPVTSGAVTNISIPKPFGAQGTLAYNLIDGHLPDGLSFDTTTGIISGTATTAHDDQNITVVVDVTNGGHVVSSGQCKYTVQVNAAGTSVADATGAQQRHIRTGDPYAGLVTITGGIPDYDLSITDPALLPYISLKSDAHNQPQVELGGITVDAGPKTVGLTLANGDVSVHQGYATFVVHDPLSIGPVGDMHVQRMASAKTWTQVPYDPATVIPDVANGTMPEFTYTNTQNLPAGITFDTSGYLAGATSAAAGTYGPFTATITDYSGQSATSGDFNIIVDERAPIEASLNGDQTFKVEWDEPQTLKSFTVTQPDGAKNLALTWTLASKDGSPVPGWLTIDAGKLTAAEGIPYDQIGTFGPFVATVTDTDGSTASVEFPVTLQDWPAPAQLTAITSSGTVSGTEVGEADTSVPVPALRSMIAADTVIGGTDAVTFLSSNPVSPAGLTLDTTEGTFTGTPTEAYKGEVSVAFEDTRGRQGALKLGLDVKPYPAISVAQNYDLPRNADAATIDTPIQAVQNDGYWSNPTWSVDTSRGEDISQYGLSINSTSGQIIGRTDAAVGTVISNIVLKTTSTGANGEKLDNWSAPFSITVAAPIPMVASYEPSTATYFLEDGTLAFKGATAAAPKLKGSYKAPVTWSLDAASEVALSAAGLSINPATGEIVGQPTQFGRWNALVTATDSEGSANAVPASLAILSTMFGNIEHSGSADVSRTLRVGEPFTTQPVAVTHVMPPVVFGLSPANSDAGLVFSAATGAFEAGSKFLTSGQHIIDGTATDADDRTFGGNPVRYSFLVRSPLSTSISGNKTSLSSRQYSGETSDRINIGFAMNTLWGIGNVTYSIDGAMPGTLVYETVNGYQLASNGQAIAASALPADALVFNTVTAALKGVPSQAGTFTFKIVAHDDHADSYASDDLTRIPNNTASSQTVTLTVAPASPLQLVSSENPKGVVVPNGNGVMTVTPKYAAYGAASTFSVSGTLPPGITYAKDGNGVYFSGSFTGTAAQLGTYSATVSITDSLGRTASLPVSFKVFLSTDAIGLAMTDITAKVGYPVTLQPVASNYFGALRFYSYDLASTVGGQLSLDTSSGLLGGSFGKTEDYTVNIYVTDATNRITSKPLQIHVIPNLRVTVPDQVSATQDQSLTRTVITDYKIGTVTYEKANPSAWPIGVNVNATTGAITSTPVIAAAKSYPGLQIKATDTFQSGGSTQTDTQTSNPFTIVVGSGPAMAISVPAQLDFAQTIAATKTVTTTNKRGTVTYAKGPGGTWPDGLSVDPSNGSVTGTTIAPVGLYSGLTVVGTTADGVPATSNTFAVNVTAKPNLPTIWQTTWGNAGAKPVWIVTKAVPGNQLWVNNKATGDVYGYTGTLPPGVTMNTTNGVLQGTPTAIGSYQFTYTVRDAYGFGTDYGPFTVNVVPVVAISWDMPDGGNYPGLAAGSTTVYTFKVKDAYGKVTYTTAAALNLDASFYKFDPVAGTLTYGPMPAAGKVGYVYVVATDESGRSSQKRFGFSTY